MRGFTQAFDDVIALGIEDSGRGDELGVALIHEYGVEDVHQTFVDKEGLEQCSYNGSSLSKDEECTINPGAGALKDCEKGNLR